ncbi:hypothetical protein OCU04_000345 [Sclerotinia nivalis]|uniref:Fungal-type protein kinase domain-containing protein n=1 Tax=Sclerotinia nivalis TaxID=352851 RepID=A0A9X0AVW4_9HELO|nr:hypothetical protein OCU04_000345 [Sclerotinia nivalis]
MIETDEGGNYITFSSMGLSSSGKLYLEDQPMASCDGLVGAGTTCYRAKLPGSIRWDFVLKFKWRWARDRPESELLKLAKENCTWGAVSFDYYQEVESTANLRRGLRWGTHKRFVRMHSCEGHVETKELRQEVACTANELSECTEETNNFFQNRILACIVTSPIGRPVHTFGSVLELLQVFRDAIKCHRSLFCDAKILHQDVSVGNIVIFLDGQDKGEPKGILIDFDSATKFTEGSGTDTGIIGTRPFMAIGHS